MGSAGIWVAGVTPTDRLEMHSARRNRLRRAGGMGGATDGARRRERHADPGPQRHARADRDRAPRRRAGLPEPRDGLLLPRRSERRGRLPGRSARPRGHLRGAGGEPRRRPRAARPRGRPPRALQGRADRAHRRSVPRVRAARAAPHRAHPGEGRLRARTARREPPRAPGDLPRALGRAPAAPGRGGAGALPRHPRASTGPGPREARARADGGRPPRRRAAARPDSDADPVLLDAGVGLHDVPRPHVGARGARGRHPPARAPREPRARAARVASGVRCPSRLDRRPPDGGTERMSELIDNETERRKDLLKHLILQLHVGAAPAKVQRQLVRMLGQVPYGMVVEVEQELMADGMPPQEVTRLCHLHGAALQGAIEPSAAAAAPPGHPVHVFHEENAALLAELDGLDRAAADLDDLRDEDAAGEVVLAMRARLNALTDVEKHYLRKEHLLFPYLEKHGEARALLRAALEALAAAPATAAEARAVVALAVRPAASAIRDMIDREENILLPMAQDTLGELEWWEIARQSAEVGFCLVEPREDWRPATAPAPAADEPVDSGRIRLPTGTLSAKELEAILNALPLDATFVDAEDRVRYFTHGKDRVFARSRAVLGRKVQFCHPPSSVDTVDRILQGFRSGKQDRAAFWIEQRGRFVHIEYVALRDAAGAYLGCLEVTQDLTAKRALTGEQRLLSWTE